MLVEIKDERVLDELMERGVAEEVSPLIAYYKDELKCQLEGLKPVYDLNEKDINEIVDELSYGWSDIDFDDVAEQVAIMAKEYIKERTKYSDVPVSHKIPKPGSQRSNSILSYD